MTRSEKILIVDDTPANLSVLTDLLEPLGFTIAAVRSGAMAMDIVDQLKPDLILLDILMPGMDGFETCRRIKSDAALANTPVIFLSARDDMQALSEGFRAGASDYIVKPFQPEEVLTRLRHHLALASMSRELHAKNEELAQKNAELQEEIRLRRVTEEQLSSADSKLTMLREKESRQWGIDRFIGRSRTISDILASVRRLQSFSGVNVLITGESGTGKELVARAIHYGGAREKGPFIAVNCVAIPEELAESILFGHVKGSFTGATMDRKGYFELAHGGTLFLDEIGDMPVTLQAKLLRVLEDGEVTPVGAMSSRRVDVRVVAATNANLESQVNSGAFRQDLYFRLAQFEVKVPPLRDRKGDIPLLAEHFLSLFATEMGIPVPPLSTAAVDALTRYPFPGNIRELKNIIERALIESGGEEIQPRHLYLSNLSARVPAMSTATASMPALAPSRSDDIPLNLGQAEAILMKRALEQADGNIAKAARLLGVNRTRIYRKLQGENSEGS